MNGTAIADIVLAHGFLWLDFISISHEAYPIRSFDASQRFNLLSKRLTIHRDCDVRDVKILMVRINGLCVDYKAVAFLGFNVQFPLEMVELRFVDSVHLSILFLESSFLSCFERIILLLIHVSLVNVLLHLLSS